MSKRRTTIRPINSLKARTLRLEELRTISGGLMKGTGMSTLDSSCGTQGYDDSEADELD
jgi:hypothetical protein